jgi:hypothetical protein
MGHVLLFFVGIFGTVGGIIAFLIFLKLFTRSK